MYHHCRRDREGANHRHEYGCGRRVFHEFNALMLLRVQVVSQMLQSGVE
jgi:hypothetical protein